MNNSKLLKSKTLKQDLDKRKINHEALSLARPSKNNAKRNEKN